ncbi:DUF5052 family protein (plasmid) [Bacillus paralicheniformis]|uniref:DUF5052 family protein n=1 Tax=Bacillus paralicheniformis TaxID=1648923 RepID=UPI0031F5CDD1
MKKAIATIIILLLVALSAGCESWDRMVKDFNASNNGLERTATVYDQNGNKIKTYKGKFDVEVNDYGNKVKFDLDGKRIMISNAVVIVEETRGAIMIYVIIGILILAAPFVWMEIAERRIQEWEKEK